MVLKIDTFYNFTPPVVLCLAGVHKIVLRLLLSLPGVHQLPAVLDAEDDLVAVVLHLSVERVLRVGGSPVIAPISPGPTKLIGIGVRIFL